MADRITKTPQQRAEETLARAERRLKRVDARLAEHRQKEAALFREHREASRRLRYAQHDPALLPEEPEDEATPEDGDDFDMLHDDPDLGPRQAKEATIERDDNPR